MKIDYVLTQTKIKTKNGK